MRALDSVMLNHVCPLRLASYELERRIFIGSVFLKDL